MEALAAGSTNLISKTLNQINCPSIAWSTKKIWRQKNRYNSKNSFEPLTELQVWLQRLKRYNQLNLDRNIPNFTSREISIAPGRTGVAQSVRRVALCLRVSRCA